MSWQLVHKFGQRSMPGYGKSLQSGNPIINKVILVKVLGKKVPASSVTPSVQSV